MITTVAPTKTCKTCLRELPIGEFYRHPNTADGHFNHCKSCQREKMRAYTKLPHARELVAIYQQTHKEAARRSHRKYIAANPLKRRTLELVREAIRKGTLRRGPCEVCGATSRIEGHHEDYSKPLEVVWLCRKHHFKLHWKPLWEGR